MSEELVRQTFKVRSYVYIYIYIYIYIYPNFAGCFSHLSWCVVVFLKLNKFERCHGFSQSLCLLVFKWNLITSRVPNNHGKFKLPVREVGPLNSTTFVGIPVDLATVPPDIVIPNNTKDPPGQPGNVLAN